MEKTCRLVHITYRENKRGPSREEYKHVPAYSLCRMMDQTVENIRHGVLPLLQCCVVVEYSVYALNYQLFLGVGVGGGLFLNALWHCTCLMGWVAHS